MPQHYYFTIRNIAILTPTPILTPTEFTPHHLLPFHSLGSHRDRLLLYTLLGLLLYPGISSSGCLFIGPSRAENVIPEDSVGGEIVLEGKERALVWIENVGWVVRRGRHVTVWEWLE